MIDDQPARNQIIANIRAAMGVSRDGWALLAEAQHTDGYHLCTNLALWGYSVNGQVTETWYSTLCWPNGHCATWLADEKWVPHLPKSPLELLAEL